MRPLAALHGRSDGHVDVRVTAPRNTIRIIVADDGAGIPPNLRNHLRQRFTRGPDATRPGTGLGLALVKRQAALHGGYLHLATAATGGLQAEFVLGATDRRDKPNAAASADRPLAAMTPEQHRAEDQPVIGS